MAFLNTDIIDSISESEEYKKESVFKNKEKISQFNDIMDNIKKYADTEFKCTVESVKVQHMSDDTYVCEMEDLVEYMEYNGIQTFEEAVNNICTVNQIPEVTLSIDEEALLEAKELALEASKKDPHHVCAKCGNVISQCTCENYSEAVDPAIELFESLVEAITYCEAAGIPVALKKARSL